MPGTSRAAKPTIFCTTRSAMVVLPRSDCSGPGLLVAMSLEDGVVGLDTGHTPSRKRRPSGVCQDRAAWARVKLHPRALDLCEVARLLEHPYGGMSWSKRPNS